MKMKKLIALLLCLAMVLTACGGTGSSTAGSTTSALCLIVAFREKYSCDHLNCESNYLLFSTEHHFS